MAALWLVYTGVAVLRRRAGVLALRRVSWYGSKTAYSWFCCYVAPCFPWYSRGGCGHRHTLLLTLCRVGRVSPFHFLATLWLLSVSLALHLWSRSHATFCAVGGALLRLHRSRWRSLRTIRPITRATRLIGTASSGLHGTTIRPARGYVLRVSADCLLLRFSLARTV